MKLNYQEPKNLENRIQREWVKELHAASIVRMLYANQRFSLEVHSNILFLGGLVLEITDILVHFDGKEKVAHIISPPEITV